VLDPKAVLLLRGFLASNPDLDVLYADSAELDPWISKLLPQLKPDWSPIFHKQFDYVGRPCVFRRDVLVEAAASLPQTTRHLGGQHSPRSAAKGARGLAI
jgi:hypothetical protein